MAGEKENSTLEVTSNPTVVTSNPKVKEVTVLQITPHKLNRLNFIQWSQSVMMFISRKGREKNLPKEVVTKNQTFAESNPFSKE